MVTSMVTGDRRRGENRSGVAAIEIEIEVVFLQIGEQRQFEHPGGESASRELTDETAVSTSVNSAKRAFISLWAAACPGP